MHLIQIPREEVRVAQMMGEGQGNQEDEAGFRAGMLEVARLMPVTLVKEHQPAHGRAFGQSGTCQVELDSG